MYDFGPHAQELIDALDPEEGRLLSLRPVTANSTLALSTALRRPLRLSSYAYCSLLNQASAALNEPELIHLIANLPSEELKFLRHHVFHQVEYNLILTGRAERAQSPFQVIYSDLLSLPEEDLHDCLTKMLLVGISQMNLILSLADDTSERLMALVEAKVTSEFIHSGAQKIGAIWASFPNVPEFTTAEAVCDAAAQMTDSISEWVSDTLMEHFMLSEQIRLRVNHNRVAQQRANDLARAALALPPVKTPRKPSNACHLPLL